jgi:hypothetical protein
MSPVLIYKIARMELHCDLTQSSNIPSNSSLNLKAIPVIETFPVDLNLLFWSDNITIRNQTLDSLASGGFGWILTPWGGHFISGHVEGADKWYLYAARRIEVRTPLAGTLEDLKIADGTVFDVNGTAVVKDVGLNIDLGNDYYIQFGHLDILKNISDIIDSTDSYSFSENEFVGYTPDPWALDFYFSYKHCNICPYPYLSPELQSNLTEFYNLQYHRAKIGGTHPESNLCNNMSIEIENTIWSVWWYDHGPFDSYFNAVEWNMGFDASPLTLLNRNFTNPETFHKDPRNHSESLSEDVIGVFSDGIGQDIPEYTKIGASLIELVEGNHTTGILKLMPYENEEWGWNVTAYARFCVIQQNQDMEDDLLTIEYFPSLPAAQSGFTEDNITYTRYIRCSFLNGGPGHEDNGIGLPIGIQLCLIATSIALVTLWWEKKHSLHRI